MRLFRRTSVFLGGAHWSISWRVVMTPGLSTQMVWESQRWQSLSPGGLYESSLKHLSNFYACLNFLKSWEKKNKWWTAWWGWRRIFFFFNPCKWKPVLKKKIGLVLLGPGVRGREKGFPWLLSASWVNGPFFFCLVFRAVSTPLFPLRS